MLILNLKMNLSLNNVKEYEKYIHNKDVIVLPQYPYLTFFNEGDYQLGSQDVSKYTKGSYTGEVCAKGLKTIGVKYVLVGHSERRKYFNEDLNDIELKLNNIIENDMTPIYCIDIREDYNKQSVVSQLEIIPKDISNIIIACEPVWLIGSIDLPNIDKINEIFKEIHSFLENKNINYKIVYGGGVNSSNVSTLKNIAYNDGFIISTSALNISELEYLYNLN